MNTKDICHRDAETQSGKSSSLSLGASVANPPLEVIDAKQSAAILKDGIAKIDHLDSLAKRGEALNSMTRMAIGAQLSRIKPHIPHGNSEEGDGDGFVKVIERWGYNPRTAREWIQQFSVLIAQAPKKLKTADAAVFTRMLAEGLTEGEEQKALALIPQITGGQSISDFVDANAERRKGGLMPIRFHCPTCREQKVNTLLKQIAGRKIKCPKCGETCKAKPDVKDASAADRERADEALRELAAQIESLVGNAEGPSGSSSEWALGSDEARQTLTNACLRLTAHAKKTRSRKVRAKAARGAKEAKV